MQAATKKEFLTACEREALRNRRYLHGFAILLVQARDEGKLICGIKEEIRNTDTLFRCSDGTWLVLLVEPRPGLASGMSLHGVEALATRLRVAFGPCRIGYARSEGKRVAADTLFAEARANFKIAQVSVRVEGKAP